MRGARRRARAAREDDDGPGPVGAAARRGRLGDHAGHAVAGAGGAGVRAAPGAAGERARRPGRHRGGEPGARRRSRAAGAVLGGLRVVRRRDGRAPCAGLRRRAPADRARRAGRSGRPHGARDLPAARAVADAVAASPHLRLAGVAGYEGALAHDASPAGLDAVRRYLRDLAALHAALARRPTRPTTRSSPRAAAPTSTTSPTSSARWPAPGTRVVLRSGAYVIHDDGFYRGISPLRRGTGDAPLTSAMHAWARVVSRPEPGLALLDAGKRDVPFDRGCPSRSWPPTRSAAPARPLAGARSPRSTTSTPSCACDPDTALDVGDVVRLGLSHPCTAFDKWRLIPVVDGAGRAGPRRRRPRPHLLLTGSVTMRLSSATPPSSTAPERRRYRADVLVDGARIAAIRRAGGPPPAARPRARRRRPGARARLHRHARPLRPADPAATRPPRQGQPGRHHRGARPGRPVLRAGRRRRAGQCSARRSPAGTATRRTSTSTGARWASTSTGSTAGIAGNAAYLVPQGTVRVLVVGWDDAPGDAPPSIAADAGARRAPRWPRAPSACQPG